MDFISVLGSQDDSQSDEGAASSRAKRLRSTPILGVEPDASRDYRRVAAFQAHVQAVDAAVKKNACRYYMQKRIQQQRGPQPREILNVAEAFQQEELDLAMKESIKMSKQQENQAMLDQCTAGSASTACSASTASTVVSASTASTVEQACTADPAKTRKDGQDAEVNKKQNTQNDRVGEDQAVKKVEKQTQIPDIAEEESQMDIGYISGYSPTEEETWEEIDIE